MPKKLNGKGKVVLLQETQDTAVLQFQEEKAKAGLGMQKALEKLNTEMFFTNDIAKKSSTGHLVKPTDQFRREGSTSHSMWTTLNARGV